MKVLRKRINETINKQKTEQRDPFILPNQINRETHSSQSNYLKTQGKMFNKLDMDRRKISISSTHQKQLHQKKINLPNLSNKSPLSVQNISLIKHHKNREKGILFYPSNLLINKIKMNLSGDQSKLSCYSVTHQGMRIKNQDRIVLEKLIINDQIYQYAAVFDGHGGSMTSTYLATNLHIEIQSQLMKGMQPLESIKVSLAKIEAKIMKNPRIAFKSGSCALVCLLLADKCWVANIGDSRLLSIDKNNNVAQITNDHKPENQIQRRRIQYYGGEVYRNLPQSDSLLCDRRVPYRVHPGRLSVSRTIGDLIIKKKSPNIVISEPQLFSFGTNDLRYLLIFTDGMYEKLSNREICSYFLTPHKQDGYIQLFKEATKRQSQDNRSLIAILINP